MALHYPVPHAQKGLLLFRLPRACPGAAAGLSGGPRRRPGWGRGLQLQTFLWHAEGELILTRLRLRPPRANTRVHLARLHPFAVEFPNEIRKSARRRGRSGKPRSFGGNLSAREGWVSFVRLGGGRRCSLCVPLWVEQHGAWILSGAVGERLRGQGSGRKGETGRRWGGGGRASTLKAEAARASKSSGLPAPSIRTDARARRTGSRAVRALEVSSAGKRCAVVDVRQGFERGL